MSNTVRAKLVEAQVVHTALRQAQGERKGLCTLPFDRLRANGRGCAYCPSTGSGRTVGLRRLFFDELGTNGWARL